jgi:hypothetical protein
MNILQTPAGAVGLALILGVTLRPGFAPAAKPATGNVVYVDNIKGNDANPGTSAEPKATIQAGENAAEALYGNEGTVVVRGGGPAYVESVTVSSSMIFAGNKVKGKHDPLPVVQGGFYANGIAALTVTGFDIQGGLSGTPDSGSAAGISSTGSGVFLENVAAATITDNKVGALVPAPTAAIWAETNQGSGAPNISGNEVAAGQTGIYLWASGSATVEAQVEKNEVAGAQAGGGIVVTLLGTAQGNFTITNNTVQFCVGGIYLSPNESSQGVFTVNKNLVTENVMMGGIAMVGYNGSTSDFSASSNVIEGNEIGGMFVMAGDSGTLVNAFLSGNTITYNHGAQISARGLGTLNFVSDGAHSNDLRQTPENVEQPYLGSLYNSIENTENGFIFINHELHPANEDLP